MAYELLSNSPIVGSIAWSDVEIVFNGVSYPVESGSTPNKYTYWKFSSPTQLQTSPNYPDLSDDDCLVFINNGGVGLSVLDASVIDGSMVVPGTISSDAIMANAIVGSHIAAHTIIGEHVVAGSLTGDHIAANSITADKIDSRGLAIRDAEGNVIFGVGTGLDVSFVNGIDEKVASVVAKTITLSASSQTFTFSGAGTPSPEIQTITLTATCQNIATAITWVATVYDAAGTLLGTMPIGGSGESRTITISDFSAIPGADRVVVTASGDGAADQMTVVKLRDGLDGELYSVVIESTNGDVFRPGQSMNTTLIAHVFRNGVEITDQIPEGRFRWRRVSYYTLETPYDDATWNASYQSGYKQISVTTNAVTGRATFHCDILNS